MHLTGIVVTDIRVNILIVNHRTCPKKAVLYGQNNLITCPLHLLFFLDCFLLSKIYEKQFTLQNGTALLDDILNSEIQTDVLTKRKSWILLNFVSR